MFEKIARFSKFLVCILLLANFVACSGGRKTLTTVSDETGGSDLTGSDLTGSDLGTGGSTLGTTTGTTGNIFDQNLTAEETAAAGTTGSNLAPSVQDQESACLATNAALGLGGGYGDNYYQATGGTATTTGAATAQTQYACYRPRTNANPYNFDPNSIYQASADSYSMIDRCIEMVLDRAPYPGSHPQEVEAAFTQGQLALVRCYRNLLQEQADYAPWSEPVQASFRYNIGNIFQVTLLIGRGPGR